LWRRANKRKGSALHAARALNVCGAFLIGFTFSEARLHVVRTAMCDVNRVINHKTRVKICWATLGVGSKSKMLFGDWLSPPKNAIYEKFSLSLL
jgi:hypothetical protein